MPSSLDALFTILQSSDSDASDAAGGLLLLVSSLSMSHPGLAAKIGLMGPLATWTDEQKHDMLEELKSM